MSEEEESIFKTFKEGYGLTKTEERMLINLIEKQNIIIKRQSYTNKKLRKTLKTVRKERNKQNKIIYKLAKYIASLDIDYDICSKLNKDCDQMSYGECEACIIEYFTKKVEGK